MTDLAPFAALSRRVDGLAVVSTLRADATIQASLVNVAVLTDPFGGAGERLAFVTYGPVKLANLRARPQVTATVRLDWSWRTVEGEALLVGPEDNHAGVDAERIRLLLREIFTAAGGAHDDWDEYDRTMLAQRRTAVLVTPSRSYGN